MEDENLPGQNGPEESDEQLTREKGIPRKNGIHFARKLFESLRNLTRLLVKRVFWGIKGAQAGESEGEFRTDMRGAFSHISVKKLFFAGNGAMAAVYLMTGIYVVNPGEAAVVRFFGEVTQDRVGEGIHYRLPWPFEKVDVVDVSTIRREGIGMALPDHEVPHSTPKIIQFMTGDENIIDIQSVVQYRVRNPSAYLFNVDYAPCLLINETIRSAITEIGGKMQVDEILTIGKERLQELIRVKAQNILDQYNSGMQLVGINLNKVYPPEEVAGAFRDVSNASQDREKTINDAWGYLNSQLPQARGEAEKLLKEGEGYKAEVINKSRGEAERFAQVYSEYEKDAKAGNADVTRSRLYLESMEKVMARVKKYFIDSQQNGKINLRLFETK